MSSKHKIGKLKKIFTIISENADCVCANPKPTDVSEPKPISQTRKPDPPPIIRRPSSSNSQSNYFDCLDDNHDEEYSPTTASATVGSSSSYCSRSPNHRDGDAIGRQLRGSVAVMKESDDPYRDFRQSMVQMMAARDIWPEDGLEELLKCFLRLNSPSHHEIIIRAFTEIRDGGEICNRQC